MNWLSLTEIEALDELIQSSVKQPFVIFKHSTRCSISAMVKDRLERQWTNEDGGLPVYYLDLIRYRPVSDHIAVSLGVQHESPQILLIKNGACVYNVSHSAINAHELRLQISAL